MAKKTSSAGKMTIQQVTKGTDKVVQKIHKKPVDLRKKTDIDDSAGLLKEETQDIQP